MITDHEVWELRPVPAHRYVYIAQKGAAPFGMIFTPDAQTPGTLDAERDAARARLVLAAPRLARALNDMLSACGVRPPPALAEAYYSAYDALADLQRVPPDGWSEEGTP